jgi:penicillin-binding protein 1C
MRRHRLRFALLLAAAIGCGAAIGWWSIRLPAALSEPASATLSMLDREGDRFAEVGSTNARAQDPVALESMGRWLPEITVALEDHRFRSHGGVDWHATLSALVSNVRQGRIVAGGSTITQQLIKLASGRSGRSWRAKFYEACAALKLEASHPKEWILREYMNRAEFGNRLVGPEAAARCYFGKWAADLTLPEAVFLAGIPQAPTRFNPWTHPEAARGRFRRSVAVLQKRGTITKEQAELLTEAVPTVGRHIPKTEAPDFAEAVQTECKGIAGAVRTTLDRALQREIEACVRAHLDELNRHDITSAAVVVMQNSNGAVRALVGSPERSGSQINCALARRSCGSTLKPFIYADAIDRRVITAATMLRDSEEAIRGLYSDYDPRAYNRRYFGPVSAREALACSLNVPAILVLDRLGARRGFYSLQQWGLRMAGGLDEYGAGFILGNADVRPLDLAAAYAGLARGGVAIEPSFLEGHTRSGRRVISPEAAAIVTDILCDNAARARAFGIHSPLNLGARVAAKTGTSSGFRDAWTAGFTRDHTVVVWVGNTDGRPMDEALAIRAAAPLWATIVSGLLRRDSPLPELSATDRLVNAPTDVGRTEWFLAGTESMREEIGAAPTDLTITYPRNEAVFQIEPWLSMSQQRIEFACSPVDAMKVEWFVNNVPVPRQSNGRTTWQLAPGKWRIAACAGTEKAEIAITVE